VKIIIMAAGEQKRYEPESPKHFIRIDGERILERSIKQFRGVGQVYVIAAKPEYQYLTELGCIVEPPSETTHELSKFTSSRHLWENDDQVIFVYGDCYLTDHCAEKIRRARPDRDFTFFGVFGEMLALWLHSRCYRKFLAGIDYIKVLQDLGQGGLCGSWTLYRLLLGKDLLAHQFYTNFIGIKDESIDFDAESTLTKWLERYPKHTGSLT